MEFALNCKEFLEDLSLIQGVVERRHAMPVLSNLYVSAKKDRVMFFATDLEVGYLSTLGGEVRKDGEALIPSRVLYDAVSLAGEGLARIKKTEKSGVKVSFEGGTGYKFVGADVADFPSLPEMEGAQDKITIDGEALDEMFRLTAYAASREMSRYAINGVLLVFEGDSLKTVATDGYRLAIVHREKCVKKVKDKFEVILPHKGVRELQQLLSHVSSGKDKDKSKKGKKAVSVEFSRKENHLFFTLGSRCIVMRVLNDSFPNYERVVPKDNDKVIRFSREHLIRAVKSASVVLSDAARPVCFEFSHNSLCVASENPDSGEAKSELPISYTGEGFKIGFKASHLLDFLSIIGTDDVLVSLKSETDQALLEPADNGGKPLKCLCVIMPMRL
ncbi:MAG: DNA polymerase III subunit beta [Acidobacteriota bacterium]|nr:MAG: DNA polymerase III subunit beta [Acidobacteriota bacterium]